MLQLIAFTLISLSLILLLKQSHPTFAMLAAAVAGGLLLMLVIAQIYEPVSQLFDTLADYGVQSDLITYLLKAFGICYLTKFAAELCTDFGQTSLSGKVELVGRASLFVLSLPLIRQILELGLSLL